MDRSICPRDVENGLVAWSPSEASAGEVASHRLGSVLDVVPLDSLEGWHTEREFEAETVFQLILEHPNVWFDRRLAQDPESGVCVAGAWWLGSCRSFGRFPRPWC